MTFCLHVRPSEKWSTSTLKAPITTKDDNFDFFFFYYYFQKKTSIDISCESTIHMKYQDLFSLKKKIQCRLLQLLLGALRVKRKEFDLGLRCLLRSEVP